MKRKENPRALLPVLVFLVLYLGLGILFEYILKIPMGTVGTRVRKALDLLRIELGGEL